MSDDIKRTDEAGDENKTEVLNTEVSTGKSEAAEPVKKAAKSADKKKAAKSAKTDKPNIFVRIGKGIVKFFKDFKGETKKIIWPGRQMILKSTGVVLSTIIIVGAGIWIVDFALSSGLDALKTVSDKSKETTSVSDTSEVSDTTAASGEGSGDTTTADTTTADTTGTEETTTEPTTEAATTAAQ